MEILDDIAVIEDPNGLVFSGGNVGELFDAIANAQKNVEAVAKDALNEAFKRGNKASSYATLSSVISAVRSAYANAGVATIQSIHTAYVGNEFRISVSTMFGHKSGQWMKAVVSANGREKTPQVVGSVSTYLRRYQLQAMTFVAPEDDDGNAGSGMPQHSGEVSQADQAAAEALQQQQQTDRRAESRQRMTETRLKLGVSSADLIALQKELFPAKDKADMSAVDYEKVTAQMNRRFALPKAAPATSDPAPDALDGDPGKPPTDANTGERYDALPLHR